MGSIREFDFVLFIFFLLFILGLGDFGLLFSIGKHIFEGFQSINIFRMKFFWLKQKRFISKLLLISKSNIIFSINISQKAKD